MVWEVLNGGGGDSETMEWLACDVHDGSGKYSRMCVAAARTVAVSRAGSAIV